MAWNNIFSIFGILLSSFRLCFRFWLHLVRSKFKQPDRAVRICIPFMFGWWKHDTHSHSELLLNVGIADGWRMRANAVIKLYKKEKMKWKRLTAVAEWKPHFLWSNRGYSNSQWISRTDIKICFVLFYEFFFVVDCHRRISTNPLPQVCHTKRDRISMCAKRIAAMRLKCANWSRIN